MILAFATADPEVAGLLARRARGSSLGVGGRRGAVLAGTCAGRRAPLVPRGALRRTPAWGALLVSFFVGAALIAALVDIPIFARITVYPDSQLDGRAGAGPVPGRAAGRRARRRLPRSAGCPPGSSPPSGMVLAAVGFVLDDARGG